MVVAFISGMKYNSSIFEKGHPRAVCNSWWQRSYLFSKLCQKACLWIFTNIAYGCMNKKIGVMLAQALQHTLIQCINCFDGKKLTPSRNLLIGALNLKLAIVLVYIILSIFFFYNCPQVFPLPKMQFYAITIGITAYYNTSLYTINCHCLL